MCPPNCLRNAFKMPQNLSDIPFKYIENGTKWCIQGLIFKCFLGIHPKSLGGPLLNSHPLPYKRLDARLNWNGFNLYFLVTINSITSKTWNTSKKVYERLSKDPNKVRKNDNLLDIFILDVTNEKDRWGLIAKNSVISFHRKHVDQSFWQLNLPHISVIRSRNWILSPL